jgi:hypothetical protein
MGCAATGLRTRGGQVDGLATFAAARGAHWMDLPPG